MIFDNLVFFRECRTILVFFDIISDIADDD